MKDKIVVLTGGSNGIGRGILQLFLEKGAKVCFIDTDPNSANTLIDKYGNNNLLYYYRDIASEDIKIDGRMSKLMIYNDDNGLDYSI